MRWNYYGHGGSTQLASRFARLTIVAICVMALIGTARMLLAGDNRLLGTWKLKSFVRQNVATGERRPALGEHPEGHLGCAPTGACTRLRRRRSATKGTGRAKMFGPTRANFHQPAHRLG